eukprot:CAMPEP_0184294478 /NCGR_PEP_ID=MMETSP1049-20130417/5659_1 /TAXON_ID=77928 /ORGANISM="Proteomonas sulcata, Strain CCMP704" /LENGTH=353 /DNA_ID=CAMNT_0026602777 /DNA_START=28 /DNA_END=1090 /DNA_ORIENTATION=-
MEKLEEMQKGTRSVLQRHEQEMLSVFRSRLFEVEEKLKKNTAKKNTDTVGGVPRLWLDKAAKLSRELDHYKEESIRLDAENERLTKESNRLQAEHRSHQDDLTYLESQMAALKKENFKLKKDLEEAATVVPYLLPLPVSVSCLCFPQASMRAFLSGETQSFAPQTTEDPQNQSVIVSESGEADPEADIKQSQRMMESIARLRKLIDEERSRLREVRTSHVAALASRTELEGFLRDCLSDVKKQISKHRLEAMDNVPSQGGDIMKEERDRVLELLLSQERVITLLLEKTFPVKSAFSTYGGPRIKSQGKGIGEIGEDEADQFLPTIEAEGLTSSAQGDDSSFLNDPAWDSVQSP